MLVPLTEGQERGQEGFTGAGAATVWAGRERVACPLFTSSIWASVVPQDRCFPILVTVLSHSGKTRHVLSSQVFP